MSKLRLSLPIVGLVTVALLISSTLGATGASLRRVDLTPTPRAYLPFVARSTSPCPATSTNVYQSGPAHQYDEDDPVRPAQDHADKNIALRGYTVTDPALRRFVDYGCDDTQAQPPQFATLFDQARVPTFSAAYRVYDWIWADSPDPGQRGGLIAAYPVTALGLQTTPGELLLVPTSGYNIGGDPQMEVLVLYADQDTVALRYTREDSSAPPGYTIHVDNICTDPNLLALYNRLDDPDGPRYVYPKPEYPLPNLPAGHPIGVVRGTEVVVAIADTGAFQDPRSLNEWWQVRPGYASERRYPSDSDYANQWGPEKVNVPEAWALSTGQDVVIAVLDTGVDLDHPDLSTKVLTDLDRDFVNGDLAADDDHGHGTHVAGIAAAATDNGIGIAGMGWHTEILPLKVLDNAGQGYFSDVADAISYAIGAGADVINLSIGPETTQRMDCPPFLQTAIDEAYAAGLAVVAAAGNNGEGSNGERIEIPPANCNHVIGVAATRQNDTIPSYSSPGAHVSVAAPGGGSTDAIYSTLVSGRYGLMSGTSMATPHVSGLAALVIAHHPAYSPDRVASAILDNALDLGPAGWDEYYGCGRIDAARALSNGALAAQPLCLQGVTSAAQPQPAAVPDAPFAPGQIIVAYRSTAPGAALSARYAASADLLPSLGAWRLHVPVGREREVLAQLRADPDVLHADLNYRVVAQD
ncbi:MAG: S8 family serine peptidase [Chloroflexota bacterium]|nr:S8 family serine peptidase [Chloroflexota bacterium]